MGTIIAICSNQKGGVGKTTLATNIAGRLANQHNQRVLLVEADPQGNATTNLGIELESSDFTLNDVLAALANGAPSTVTREAILKAVSPWAIDLILADRDSNSDTRLGREYTLRKALSGVREDYDYIVIDSPPSLGMLTTNALVASSLAYSVSTPRETNFDGVAEMATTLAAVRTLYNKHLRLAASS